MKDVNKPWNFPHTNAKDVMMDTDDKLLKRLKELDKKPLYANAKVGALLLILTFCKSHGMSNACVNDLMQVLSSNILPRQKSFPTTEQKASRSLKAFV